MLAGLGAMGFVARRRKGASRAWQPNTGSSKTRWERDVG